MYALLCRKFVSESCKGNNTTIIIFIRAGFEINMGLISFRHFEQVQFTFFKICTIKDEPIYIYLDILKSCSPLFSGWVPLIINHRYPALDGDFTAF